MSSQSVQYVVFMKGYVTTYISVVGRTGRELEERLGLHAHSLDAGYLLYQLAAPVALGEFEWKDRTRYSDGWHFDRSIREYVQRFDELRAQQGKRNNWDEGATDRDLLRFLERQREFLNVRAGSDRIVKLLPIKAGPTYPDSPSARIPQWKLTREKRFTLIRQS